MSWTTSMAFQDINVKLTDDGMVGFECERCGYDSTYEGPMWDHSIRQRMVWPLDGPLRPLVETWHRHLERSHALVRP